MLPILFRQTEARFCKLWQNSVVIGEAGSQTQEVIRTFSGVSFIADGILPEEDILNNDQAIAEFITVWNLGQTEPFQSVLNDFLNGEWPCI